MTHFVTPLSPPSNPHLSRRHLLRLGSLTMAASLAPNLVQARTRSKAAFERSLDLYSTKTGENIKTVYWAEGKYLAESLHEINYVLRDHHSDEVTDIDPHLLDLLHTVCRIMDVDTTVNVISGYRSATTNAMLRRSNRRIARHSFHIQGKAVDIRLPNHNITLARRVALTLQQGGVGYYRRANFLHIDTGPIRSWAY